VICVEGLGSLAFGIETNQLEAGEKKASPAF
jgi:hypothetical protein